MDKSSRFPTTNLENGVSHHWPPYHSWFEFIGFGCSSPYKSSSVNGGWVTFLYTCLPYTNLRSTFRSEPMGQFWYCKPMSIWARWIKRNSPAQFSLNPKSTISFSFFGLIQLPLWMSLFDFCCKETESKLSNAMRLGFEKSLILLCIFIMDIKSIKRIIYYFYYALILYLFSI